MTESRTGKTVTGLAGLGPMATCMRAQAAVLDDPTVDTFRLAAFRQTVMHVALHLERLASTAADAATRAQCLLGVVEATALFYALSDTIQLEAADV